MNCLLLLWGFFPKQQVGIQQGITKLYDLCIMKANKLCSNSDHDYCLTKLNAIQLDQRLMMKDSDLNLLIIDLVGILTEILDDKHYSNLTNPTIISSIPLSKPSLSWKETQIDHDHFHHQSIDSNLANYCPSADEWEQFKVGIFTYSNYDFNVYRFHDVGIYIRIVNR